MALTVSTDEPFSNPLSNTNRSPAQGNMMASPTSLDAFEVVTPVLSTADVLIDIEPKLTNGMTIEAPTENNADTAKATVLKKSAEVGLIEGAIEMKESAEKGKVEEAITEQAPGTSAERKAITVNGSRHVEVSHETHSEHCIIVDGTCYVQESAPELPKTAYDLLESADYAEHEELSQEGFRLTSNFKFRGYPIMLYIGTQSYSVHASILTNSDVLGSMPLEEAEDGSYSISLPKEDPVQFEKLLTYMYQGTWEPENCGGGGCWGGRLGQVCDSGEVCYCWTNMKYMQLYAIACKYAVQGLAEKVASKLDLEQNVLEFCEAFEKAYEMCPGSHLLQSLFRRNLVTVFENTLRMSVDEANNGSWGKIYKSGDLASEIGELVLCGGDFAVDLVRAFAAARESACRARLHTNQQDAGDHDGWGCDTVEGGNGWGLNCNNEVPGACLNTAQVVNDGRQCGRTPAPVPATLSVREDVEDIQGRVRYLEDMVSELQLIAEESVQTQQPTFQQPPNGSAPGFIAPGWGPGPSVPAKASWFQTDSGGRVVGETNNLSVPLYQPPVTTTERVHPSLDW